MDSESRFRLAELLSHLLVYAKCVRDDCQRDLDPFVDYLADLEWFCNEVMSELGYLCLKKHTEPPTEDGEYIGYYKEAMRFITVYRDGMVSIQNINHAGFTCRTERSLAFNEFPCDWFLPLPKGGA